MAVRGRPPKDREEWMVPVAELMTQEHMSFSAACQALGTRFPNSTSERAAQFCEPFRDVLNALGFKYHALTGDNPLLTKGYLTGVLVDAIRRLMEMDQPDKIAVLGKLLADLMGWTEVQSDAPVAFGLTQTQIDELRAKIEDEEAAAAKIPIKVVVVDGQPN